MKPLNKADNTNFNFQQLSIGTDSSNVTTQRISQECAKLNPIVNKIKETFKKQDYSSDYASVVLSYNNDCLNESKKLSNKLNDATTLVLIGIGGSNLGTMAVLEGKFGLLKNIESKKKLVLFADTVDQNKLIEIARIIETKLKAKEKVIFNGISKSGSTTETIANLMFFLEKFRNYVSKNPEYVVITTDKSSPLEKLALNRKYSILNIPKKVGGRYSVFSNVGLFPLLWAEVDCSQLLKGARKAVEICTNNYGLNNPAVKLASIYHLQNRMGKKILDEFIFDTSLEALGKWHRQLMAESIGKQFSASGNVKLNAGMTPTVSIGSTDLHSIGQLYFGGPKDKLFAIISVKQKEKIILKKDNEIEEIVPNVSNKSIVQLMDAILNGTKNAMKESHIPFVTIELQELNEENLGFLMQLQMIQIIMLGHLMNVNPFDQPAVELYKNQTKTILQKK